MDAALSSLSLHRLSLRPQYSFRPHICGHRELPQIAGQTTPTISFLRRGANRRNNGRNRRGLNKAALRQLASILELAACARRILAMQPFDLLAVLVSQAGAARIDGGDALGFLKERSLGRQLMTRTGSRMWRAAIHFAAKVAAAAAALAAIWLFLFGKSL